MRLVLGLDDYQLHKANSKVPYVWDLGAVVNPHMLLVGKSGSGKTHTLRNLAGQMRGASPQTRVHIMDVHGDIHVGGCSDILFSETSPYGLNPLRISPDPNHGGPRRRIQDFIATVGTARKLGSKQEATLRVLLTELYEANGFYLQKPESWHLEDPRWNRDRPKKFPTLADCCRFVQNRLKQMALGGDSKAASLLALVNKDVQALNRKLKRSANQHLDNPEIARLEEGIAKNKEALLAHYSEYVQQIETGHELDQFNRYGSEEVVQSVWERIENLSATGIFKDAPPPFDPANPLWRYDLSPLREDEKRMFVEFRLQELFAGALERGIAGGHLRHAVILDEAHLFFREDPDNILNTLAKEGRKFGIAMVCASQSPAHFSDDFVSNVAAKFVLGIDPLYWDGAIRKMRIEEKTLRFIKPHHTMAVQMSMKGNTRCAFDMVNVAG